MKIVLEKQCKSQKCHQYVAHLLKFGNKTANLFPCFPSLSASNMTILCILDKLSLTCQQNMCHKLISSKWCTYTLLHLAPWHFLCFRGRSKLMEKGWPQHFLVQRFHAHFLYQLKNEFLSTEYLPVNFWNNFFTWCHIYRHKYNEKATWL